MTQLDYRAKAYFKPGKGADTIIYSGHTTCDQADRLLAGFLKLPMVTGGHLERCIQGIGWAMADDGEAEIERRRIDEDAIYPHT